MHVQDFLRSSAGLRVEDVNSVSIWTVTSLSLDDHRYSCEPCALLSEVFPSSPPVGPVTDLLYPDKRSVTTNCLKRYLCRIGCENNAIWYMSVKARNNQQIHCVSSFVAEKQWKSAGRKYISYDWNSPIFCHIMSASLITLFCFECIFLQTCQPLRLFYRSPYLLFATNL